MLTSKGAPSKLCLGGRFERRSEEKTTQTRTIINIPTQAELEWGTLV